MATHSEPRQAGIAPDTRTPDRVRSRFWPWRFVLVSLASIIVGIPVAFGHSIPTAGFTHWRGTMVSIFVTCCCFACFLLSPRCPRMPKWIALGLPVLPLFSFLLCGCSTPPKLTAEDRRQDIEYLANWARECSPLVALNEKFNGIPSCETLKPRYVEFAEQARSNEEFYLVASAYFNVIGAGSCHAYLCDEGLLKWSAVGECLGIHSWGIPARQVWAGTYWPRLASGISTRVHPPFRLAANAGNYVLEDEWRSDRGIIPRGAQILKVNGLSCSSYLEFVKTKTSLRYDAFPKDWADRYLLVIDEGPMVPGWQVEFLLPDGSRLETFVPKALGFHPPRTPVHSLDAKENCTCLELTDAVGYIRIKNMWHGPLSYFFNGYIKQEHQSIQNFLKQGRGKYTKLIIDIRDNHGGVPQYVYQNLLCPFLDGPVTFKQVVGVRRKYLHDLKDSALRDLKKQYDWHITETRQVKAPGGFADEDWIWYEITRQIRPSERYAFKGKLYVLINGGSMSAADDYADLVKRLRLGTLVGQNTGGGGGSYLAPGTIRLPRSGMIFRVETEILISSDGRVNELFGTAPDVKLPTAARPASITQDDLLKDAWIKKIIAEL